MATFGAVIGFSDGTRIDYIWQGFCTDFVHTEGSDSFSGSLWLRDGVRQLVSAGTTSVVASVNDFSMTVVQGSWDEENSSVSFAPTGALSISEEDIGGIGAGITGEADLLSVTEGSFTGSFSDEDTLAGFVSLVGFKRVGDEHVTQGFGSTSFSWIRNASACLTPV